MHPTKTALLALTVIGSVPLASAAVTINLAIDSVRTSSGDFVPTSTLGLLIADVDGDGFGAIQAGASLTYGSVIGSGDFVVGQFDFTSFSTPGITAVSVLADLAGAWASGARLAVVWIPDLVIGSTSVGLGVNYGIASDITWVTPADGFSNVSQYQLISSSNYGAFSPNATTLSISDLASRASLSTIPEPSAAVALTGAAILSFAATRRRRRSA